MPDERHGDYATGPQIPAEALVDPGTGNLHLFQKADRMDKNRPEENPEDKDHTDFAHLETPDGGVIKYIGPGNYNLPPRLLDSKHGVVEITGTRRIDR
jgi:hypothetical protein